MSARWSLFISILLVGLSSLVLRGRSKPYLLRVHNSNLFMELRISPCNYKIEILSFRNGTMLCSGLVQIIKTALGDLIKSYEHWLIGGPIIAITDSHAILSLLKQKRLSPRRRRSVFCLSKFDITFEFIEGNRISLRTCYPG